MERYAANTPPAELKCTFAYLQVWPTSEFPGNAAATQQEVFKTSERCSKCGLQTPG